MAEKTTTLLLEDQLKEIDELADREKIELTPEVLGYIQKHAEAIQDKYAEGEDVKESDLQFIDEVKMWMGFPEIVRKKFPSIEMLENAKQSISEEAKKRNISFQQWVELLHLAEAAEKKKKWIDEQFQFPGNGVIEVEYLNLSKCTNLTNLPKGLTVDKNLTLYGCTRLKRIPDGLKVGGTLHLRDCTSLSSLPSGLGMVGNLYLYGCTRLCSLPNGLMVLGELDLRGCTSLSSLPENLVVAGDGKLYLSENLNEQVKEDAKRLKAAGEIRGEIMFLALG